MSQPLADFVLALCNKTDDKLCARPPQYAPAPCKVTFDLLNMKVVPESRVTCANFSLPRPLCSRVSPDVRDRQTDVRRASSLNAPTLSTCRDENVKNDKESLIHFIHINASRVNNIAQSRRVDMLTCRQTCAIALVVAAKLMYDILTISMPYAIVTILSSSGQSVAPTTRDSRSRGSCNVIDTA